MELIPRGPWLRFFTLLIVLSACGRGFIPDDGTDDTGSIGDTGDDPSACPDPAADLDDALCDDAVVPAAAAYYVGDFTVSAGGEVGGEEYQYFFANPDHEADGGEDCVAVWSITGVRSDPASCESCDFSLEIAGDIDFDASTCADDLLFPRSFETAYDVRDDDGASTVYFPSGNELGQGCIEDGRVTYTSEGWCEQML